MRLSMNHSTHTPTALATASASSPNTLPWADPQRAASFQPWFTAICAQHALAPSSLRIASADASFRRYLRVDALAGGSCIIMDAPPDKEDCKPFAHVASLMLAAGIHAPKVLAWEEALGFMLLSDLGSQTLLDVINRDDHYANLPQFINACDILVQWQLASKPGVLPPYDAALLQRELALFPDWYVAKHRQMVFNDEQALVWRQAVDLIVARNLHAPQVYVHRDYMPRNMMVTDTPSPLGILDFQDAVYGPVTYDIASLMRDAFWSWDEEFVIEVTVRYWERARKAGLLDFDGWSEDFGAFYRAVEWMGLQRHLKVAGIFARLTLRDGKPKYLADAPRFIAYIRHAANRYRELGMLEKLIDSIEGTSPQIGFAYGRM
jgi:N-acetylmuramate 1-kinase